MKLAKWQFECLIWTLAVCLVAMVIYTVAFQYRDGRELTQMAKRQQNRVIPLPGKPGDIFGRTKNSVGLLAGSHQISGVYADPQKLGEENFADTARKIADACGGGEERISQLLQDRKEKRFAFLVHDITPEQVQAIVKLNIPGVQVTQEWRRHYPNGKLAGQVLGFRRIDGEAGSGMELHADKYLKPVDGVKVLRCDASRRGRYIELDEYRPPVDGRSMVLTIDMNIQEYLEKAITASYEKFAAQAVMGVVMDCNTGEVLAIASVPDFDPNQYSIAKPENMRLRSVTDPYEPGSTFKPFIALGAVEMGKATLNSKFFCCNGLFASPKAGIIRDAPGERFGEMPLGEIVVFSSNIGMAKLGESLGNPTLHKIAKEFGFGHPTGIDLPGEDNGRLSPLSKWTSYDTYRLPFGQGQIMVTCLQLANAFSAIANGGMLYQPRIVDRIIAPDGQVVYQSQPTKLHRVIDTSVARQFIDEVLTQVVERGTGKKAHSDHWQLLGKTGTAQIGTPHGYIDRAFTGSFMGAGPATNPQVVCVISVYHPTKDGHFGGTVAAPYVKEVIEKTLAYLDVPPDQVDDDVKTDGTTADAGN